MWAIAIDIPLGFINLSLCILQFSKKNKSIRTLSEQFYSERFSFVLLLGVLCFKLR